MKDRIKEIVIKEIIRNHILDYDEDCELMGGCCCERRPKEYARIGSDEAESMESAWADHVTSLIMKALA
jgi:hypothetical protein